MLQEKKEKEEKKRKRLRKKIAKTCLHIITFYIYFCIDNIILLTKSIKL